TALAMILMLFWRTKVPKQRADSPQVVSKLKIHSARYSSGSNVREVEDVLSAQIVGDCLSMLIGKELLGDPHEGYPKELEVRYSFDRGQIRTAVRPDSVRLILPEDPYLLDQISKTTNKVTEQRLEIAGLQKLLEDERK